jgi:GPH family glycoside/pentoside/hexuronide:cation symporter
MVSPLREEASPGAGDRLSPRTRLAYGVGEIAGALPNSVSAFFFLFFLTHVAGLSPTLGGAAVLFGKVWDAFSDPLIGWLSDRTRSPLGRRYPWMLAGAIPLAIGISLQWWVPPTDNQWLLLGYYSTVSVLAFAALTAVMLPFSALAAELTHSYNERINLISFKSAFSIGGSIFALVVAQIIFARISHPSLKYLVMGSANGVLVIGAVVVCVVGTWPRYRLVQRQYPLKTELIPKTSLWQQIRTALSNAAFRWVMGLYLCAWTAVQGAAVVLPYFVVDWMGLPESSFVRMALGGAGHGGGDHGGLELAGAQNGQTDGVLFGDAVAAGGPNGTVSAAARTGAVDVQLGGDRGGWHRHRLPGALVHAAGCGGFG